MSLAQKLFFYYITNAYNDDFLRRADYIVSIGGMIPRFYGQKLFYDIDCCNLRLYPCLMRAWRHRRTRFRHRGRRWCRPRQGAERRRL